MGPKRNAALYEAVAKPIEPILTEELRHREMVAPVLAELATLFDEKDNTPRQLVEPTLFARLFAISMVQRSRMGLSGFRPLEAFSYGDTVEAKAAPHHDEVESPAGAVFRTRVINFILPDQSLGKNIRIFGLNYYHPDAKDEVAGSEAEKTTTPSGLIVTDKRGKVTSVERSPIAGETVVFAAYSKTSGDAKFYQASFLPPEETSMSFDPSPQTIVFGSDSRAVVTLPDRQRLSVGLLEGDLQLQAVTEFQCAIEQLRGMTNPDAQLSDTERFAARAVIAGTDRATLD